MGNSEIACRPLDRASRIGWRNALRLVSCSHHTALLCEGRGSPAGRGNRPIWGSSTTEPSSPPSVFHHRYVLRIWRLAARQCREAPMNLPTPTHVVPQMFMSTFFPLI